MTVDNKATQLKKEEEVIPVFSHTNGAEGSRSCSALGQEPCSRAPQLRMYCDISFLARESNLSLQPRGHWASLAVIWTHFYQIYTVGNKAAEE